MFFPLSFENLSKSILSLFETVSNYGNDYYHCEQLLKKYDFYKRPHLKERIIAFVGDIDEFHDWLKPKLDEFFAYGNFDKYFLTPDERINQRRSIAYDKIFLSRLCKRKTFKRQMMIELDLDMESCIKRGRISGEYSYFGEGMENIENRRMFMLNCIKNYVHRLFLIYE